MYEQFWYFIRYDFGVNKAGKGASHNRGSKAGGGRVIYYAVRTTHKNQEKVEKKCVQRVAMMFAQVHINYYYKSFCRMHVCRYVCM